MTNDVDAPRSGRLWWISPVLLSLLFCGLAAMSWRRWPDIIVDFGTQLYVPWRLSEGEVLYRDIRQHFGPLSLYVNAALFSVFGPSFRVLFLADIAILAGIVALLHRHLADTFDRLTAFAGCLVLVAVFGFSEYVGIGNYNYASPYTHEATHGMALSIASMLALAGFGRRPTTGRAVVAGLLLGATLLTRAELAVAATAYAVTWLACTLATTRPRPPVGPLLVAVALPSVACVLAFATAVPLPQALRSAVGAWMTLVGSSVATSPFYLEAMGFDRPWANALDVLGRATVAIVIAGAAIPACRIVGNSARGWPVRAIAALVLVAIAAGAFFVDIVELGRPFPALVTTGLALAGWAFLATAWGRDRRPALTALLALGVFALALLGKMLLHCRIAHYGFYLAMPSAVFLCVVLLWLVPHTQSAAPHARAPYRWLVIAVLLVLSGRYVHHSWTYYVRKIFPIGSEADQIVSYARDGRAQPITQALEWIDRNMAPDATFTAMPEGIMLNFLTRRRSTVSFTTFMTVDFLAWGGEDEALRELQAAPPDYVVVVHKDTREFGVGFFGRDPRYGRLVMDWVNANYRPVARFGAEPLVMDSFGIKILARIPGEIH